MEVGGTLGLLSRHMLVKSFLIHEKLKRAMDGGWKEIQEFKSFCDGLSFLTTNEKERQEIKANTFFKLASEPLKKHFAIWSNDLLFFGLFGEVETSKCLACILVDPHHTSTPCVNAEPFLSPFYKVSINLFDFRSFIISSCNDLKDINEGFHLQKLQGLVYELTEGKDIWSSSYNGGWRNIFLNQYAAHATHTQLVESAVKDSNFCSKKGRPEEYQSQLGQIRTGIITDITKGTRSAQVKDKLEKDGKCFKVIKDGMYCKRNAIRRSSFN